MLYIFIIYLLYIYMCFICFFIFLYVSILILFDFRGTYKEKAPLNKTPLTKSTNMSIWVVGTTNQLCIRGS